MITANDLRAKARELVKGKGRLRGWAINAMDATRFVVFYERRHWKYCPGCDSGESEHLDSKGQPIGKDPERIEVDLFPAREDDD